MAHKRQDCLIRCPEWWKHLRPFNKRRVSKAERRAGKVLIESDITEDRQKKPARGV